MRSRSCRELTTRIIVNRHRTTAFGPRTVSPQVSQGLPRRYYCKPVQAGLGGEKPDTAVVESGYRAFPRESACCRRGLGAFTTPASTATFWPRARRGHDDSSQLTLAALEIARLSSRGARRLIWLPLTRRFVLSTLTCCRLASTRGLPAPPAPHSGTFESHTWLCRSRSCGGRRIHLGIASDR